MDRTAVGGALLLSLAVIALQVRRTGVAELAQPLAFLLITLIPLATGLYQRPFYHRNRNLIIPVMRILGNVLPMHRRIQVSVALAMEVPPRPGVHGAVLDLMKTMTGCRALHHFLFGVFLMLPPASCLLTQATLALLAWNPHGYCATELLQSPLSQQRQRGLAATLDLLSLPLAAVQPVAELIGHTQTGLAPADAVCHATISCLCLMVQVVLPTMISALVWPRPPAGESAAEDGMACMPGLRAAAKKAGEGADLWLRRATGATSGAWVRCLVFWYLLSNVWLLCKVSEGV